MNEALYRGRSGWWKVRNGPTAEGARAECDANSQTITVRPGQGLDDTVDCILHECLHGEAPYLTEEEVEAIATAQADALVRGLPLFGFQVTPISPDEDY